MPQYLLSVWSDGSPTEVRPEPVETAATRVCAYQAELKASGVRVFFGTLTEPGSATVVSDSGGKISMADGPYVKANEQIGRVTVIDCADLDEALEWAHKASEACMGPVEVRPFMSL